MRPVFRDLLFASVAAQEAGLELIGMTVQMDLPELGLTGEAIVTDIQPCPKIEPRAGASDDRRVVTATFHHSSGDVIDLVLANELSDLTTPDLNPETQDLKPVGEADPIGTTSNHPFWSVDRQEYVQAGQLQVGERLQTLHGDTKTVVSNLPRPGPKTDVYNLEVHAEHVYFVGEDGVLVHNSQNYGTDAASRRAYLNKKFGRTGNLDADINTRGIRDEIRANGMRATGMAVADSVASPARISGSAGAIGTRAHSYSESFNNRTRSRYAGLYDVAVEQFRDVRGTVVFRRTKGSIGADVLFGARGSIYGQSPTGVIDEIFDLKTYGSVQRPISVSRQREFFRRFGRTASELYEAR